MLTGKVLLSSFKPSRYMYSTFPFDIAYDLGYRILWWYLDQYMDMVYHQMPFQDS